MKDDKLRVAVIGCGMIARARHIPEMMENPEVAEIILADVNERAVHELAKQYEIKRCVVGEDAWKRVFQMRDVDAVIICTPNSTHGPISVAALNAGKHVLVEKPMAVSREEAMQMQEAAYANEKLLLVAHHRRHQNCYVMGKTILASGLLGSIISITAEHKQPGPIEWAPDSNWFFSDHMAGGGVMMDLGIHMADVVCWYCDDEVIETKATVCKLGTPYEQSKAIVKMKSGLVANIDVAWGIMKPEKRIKVYCEKGVMVVDEYHKNGVQAYIYSPHRAHIKFDIADHKMNLVGNPKFGLDDYFIRCIKSYDMQRERLMEHINALNIVLNSILDY